jgi:hypothetical protein
MSSLTDHKPDPQGGPDPVQSPPLDDAARAREAARVATLRIVVTVLGAVLVVLAVVVFSTLILRAVKGGKKTTEATPVASTTPAAPDGAPFAATVSLPEGARVVSTALGEGRLAVTVEAGGSVTTILIDIATGREIGRVAFGRP